MFPFGAVESRQEVRFGLAGTRFQRNQPMNPQSYFNLRQWIQSPTGFVVLGLAAFVAVYLVTEHTSHVLNLLPYIFCCSARCYTSL